MPGVVVFRRRWSVGSDDFVVPGLFLFTIHLIWLIILSIVITIFDFDKSIRCIELLWFYIIGYIALLAVTVLIELAICIVSMRGSILDTSPRSSMKYWLYFKIIIMLVEIGTLVYGIIWMQEFYISCPMGEAKEIILSSMICNWIVVLTSILTIYCTFDPAGRSWVKMKQYQRSMKESESRFNYKRSGNRSRNWRQRKVMRAYQDSWDHRCRLLFCCMGNSDRTRNSFTDIARLLSDFFRDLDVVPSDVVAGLVLLRKFQKLEREAIVRQRKNGTYEFLSGVAITENTQFLALNDSRDYDHFQLVIHYMYYALSAYGWPMYLMTHPQSGVCSLCPRLRCCLMCCGRKDSAVIIEDNCCFCNYAALKQMIQGGEIEVTYVTYHVDIGETPFFVAVDYTQEKIVISIRGTLSMKDILTDLNAEGECLPLDPPHEDWLGHKGMVQAAVYIKNKLIEENLIEKALMHNPERKTQNFGLVFVGHSLGAGTAAILAILMKPVYNDLQCFSYSPPGGLLSMPAVEHSKSFITSIVVGKDVVPRVGLHQMEAMRADLINAIQRSVDPKWKTIACSVICCCCGPEPTSVTVMSTQDSNINAYNQQKEITRHCSQHPGDNTIALTLHRPLYPPGRIIHIVRHHPTENEQVLSKQPVYQAIWANTKDFDEVLISPVMLQDHMPDTVLAALEKVVTTFGPRKPQRQASCGTASITSDTIDPMLLQSSTSQICQPHSPSLAQIQAQNQHNSQLTPTISNRVCLETSFTNLKSPENGSSSPFDGKHSNHSNLSSNSNNTNSVIFRDKPLHLPKSKTVAFSNNNGIVYPPTKFKPTTLSLCETRPNPYLGKVDLIYDDWFGLAPLASPESLSELSSISSRASIGLNLNLAGSIEKYLNKITSSTVTTPSTIPAGSQAPTDIFESQLHTPKVIRRTPKFSENLANCAEDWRSINSYKRMGLVFVTNPRLPSESDSSNDEGSFETATSFSKTKCFSNDGVDDKMGSNLMSGNNLRNLPQEGSRSADNIDVQDIFNKNNKFTSLTDCNSNCPICPCTKLPSEECCKKYDHIGCIMLHAQQQQLQFGKYSITNTASSSDTYHSAMSSLTSSDCGFLQNGSKFLLPKLGTYEEETESTTLINPSAISSITRSGILESHFPVYLDSSDEKSSLLSNESPRFRSMERRPCKTVRYSQSCNLKGSRENSDDGAFCRNESLPLLSSLVEKSSPKNYAKRKKVVYPIHTPPIIQQSNNTITVIQSNSSPSSFSNLYIHRNESEV